MLGTYTPSEIEPKRYQQWLENKRFHAEPNPEKTPYTIVIPPPNVTGVLHVGHVLNNTIQDIIIRRKRMQGYEAEWLPGTDHAAIATQNVIEKQLKQEGTSRQELGRERFMERFWEWKNRSGGIIIEQLKKLGCSCDWEREAFTMDDNLSHAVAEVFVRLYRKGLIYRGQYIVNWCPRCSTAISDEETVYHDKQGKLWYMRYPLTDGSGAVTVATTRPETMLGDTAVAVNPSDERFRPLIGKTLRLPLTDREIEIISDDFVSKEFGTGAVKVTPAHDPNDFEIGVRHNLSRIIVMNDDATMNENAGKYAGMDRFKARQAILSDLEEQGYLVKTDEYANKTGSCERCDTIIEPYLSDQWFVRMKPLAEPVIDAVNRDEIRFYPDRWKKVFLSWLTNIRDWCISRQLWLGHQIPVYYCENDSCAEITVSIERPEKCPHCGGTIRQDPDVLDTWFSSQLWPFSTFGWPEETKELAYFYPTDTLVTAPEIIFFWVARMCMMGYEFMGDKPFSYVYLHGIVRDAQGRKMSKSLGNSPDPLHLIENYSADALRFSMIFSTPQGQDTYFSEKELENGRNFANKIWNAAKFAQMHTEGTATGHEGAGEVLSLPDRWIWAEYQRVIRETDRHFDQFRINDALNTVYHFIWNDLCDWYIEMSKGTLQGHYGNESAQTCRRTLLTVLNGALRLLHPFMPFVTEEIYLSLFGDQSIMIADWPEAVSDPDSESIDQMRTVQQIIYAVRNIRGEMNIPPDRDLSVTLVSADDNRLYPVRSCEGIVKAMTKTDAVFYDDANIPANAASAVAAGIDVYVDLAGAVDTAKERERLTKTIEQSEKELLTARRKLATSNFVNKAPANVVQGVRDREAELAQTLTSLRESLSKLSEK